MYEKRDLIGILLFGVAILTLLYMFMSPLMNTFINIDEYWTYSLVNLPFMQGMTVVIHDVHPPLYYLILYLFTPFGLNNLYLLKVLSIVPYILIMIVSATKIRKDYGWLTAGLFVFCLGVMSDFYVEFLTIRMYSWGLFFVLMAFIYYREVITRWDTKSWILLTAFSLLSAYTHYFFAITCGLIYLLILVEILRHHKDKLTQFAKSLLLLLAIYAPWAVILVQQIKAQSGGSREAFQLSYAIHYLLSFAIKSEDFRFEMVIYKIVALAFLIFILVLIYKKKDRFAATGIFLMYASIVVGIIALMFSFNNIMRMRYFVPVFGIFWLSASIVIGKIKNRRVLTVAFILILLLTAASLAVTHEDVTARLIANDQKTAFLDSINNNGSVIVFNTDFGYKVLHDDLNNTIQYSLSDTYFYSDDVEICDNLTEIIAKNPGKNIYLVNWGGADRNKEFENNFNLTLKFDAGQYTINLVTNKTLIN